ncbi:MAG: tetratricopeptide repeat protein, partial [Candidatus Sericytochromatia bacterium]
PDEREARAVALERLGRDEEAAEAWLALAESVPQRPTAVLALARRCLAAGDAEGATRYVERARAIAPAAFETRLLEADALMADGRAAEALPILNTLHAERPHLLFLVASRAQAHARLGEVRRAYGLAVEAQALAPADAGVAALVREFRARGASQVRLAVGEERLGAWTRTHAGLRTEAVVDDRWRLTGSLRRLDWGVAGTAQEGSVGASWQSGPWRAETHMAFAAQAGAAQAPLADASLRWEAPTLGLHAGAAEARWDESTQSLLAAGRERRGEATAWWRPVPALSLQGGLAAGALTLGGAPVGTSRTLSAEAMLHPIAKVPLTLSYGLRQRTWGQAGPAVGLPTELTAHTLALGYAAVAGPWRLEIQPGYGLVAATGRRGPTLAGTLTWAPNTGSELRLSGGWSGANLSQGGPDGYHQVELGGHWWW